jgi:hypothetical protein
MYQPSLFKRLFSSPYTNETQSPIDIFLSYSHTADRKAAVQLQRSLENFYKPILALRSMRVFRDETNLDAAPQLWISIKKALTESDTFVLLASPCSNKSKWVRKELRNFWRSRRRMGQPVRICIVLLEGTTPWTDGLSSLTGADCAVNRRYAQFIMASGTEPRVLDLRGARLPDGRLDRRSEAYRDAIASIAALVWNVGKDRIFGAHLVQRRRRIIVAISSLIVAALLAAWRFYNQLLDEAIHRVHGPAITNRQAVTVQCQESVRDFRRLWRDPVMALHHCLANNLQSLPARPIAKIDGSPNYIRISDDGDLILIVYDHQNFGGFPDNEDIPDSTAVGLYRVSTGEWILKHRLGSALGSKIYKMDPSKVLDIEAPYNLILEAESSEPPESEPSEGEFSENESSENIPSKSEPAKTYKRFSLSDGSMTECETSVGEHYAKTLTQSNSPPQFTPGAASAVRLEKIVAPENLFTTDPQDGIDIQYGPRMPDKVLVPSPNGRTIIVGTYEGRLMLLDSASGLSRGEMRVGPVYAAAYQSDSQRAYVCDNKQLFQVETGPGQGMREFLKPPLSEPTQPAEQVLAVSLSDQQPLIAMATNHRLLCLLVKEGRWIEWRFDRTISDVAALHIDSKRKKVDCVMGDDGSIVSADYLIPTSPLITLPSQTGGKSTVAWLEECSGLAWVALAKPDKKLARIKSVSLATTASSQSERTVELQASASLHSASDETMQVHALAKISGSIFLFWGDEDSISNSAIHDEQILELPLHFWSSMSRHVVFPVNVTVDNLGEGHWDCLQVRRLLPGSRKDLLLAMTNPSNGVISIGKDGSKRDVNARLVARDYLDWRERYILVLNGEEGDIWATITHPRTGVDVKYQLPWPFKDKPQIAALSEGIRKMVVISSNGDILMVDVSHFDQSK